MTDNTSLVIKHHGKQIKALSWEDGELGIEVGDLAMEDEIDILLSANETQHLISFILTHQLNTVPHDPAASG